MHPCVLCACACACGGEADFLVNGHLENGGSLAVPAFDPENNMEFLNHCSTSANPPVLLHCTGSRGGAANPDPAGIPSVHPICSGRACVTGVTCKRSLLLPWPTSWDGGQDTKARPVCPQPSSVSHLYLLVSRVGSESAHSRGDWIKTSLFPQGCWKDPDDKIVRCSL